MNNNNSGFSIKMFKGVDFDHFSPRLRRRLQTVREEFYISCSSPSGSEEFLDEW